MAPDITSYVPYQPNTSTGQVYAVSVNTGTTIPQGQWQPKPRTSPADPSEFPINDKNV